MSLSSSAALVLGVGVAAALAGCVTAVGLTGDVGGAGGTSGAGAADSTGAGTQCVPPAMQSIIRTCTNCHSDPPTKGVPNKLTTIADFQAKSPLGTTYGERSIIRMKDASSPMPPDGLLPASQVAAFEAWVNGGYQLEACPNQSTSNTSAGNGGVTTGSGAGNGATSGSGLGTTGSGSGGGNITPSTCAQANDVVGCCDPSGVLYYCDAGSLATISCTSGTVCGWNAAQAYYDCVASPGGADPTNQNPMACGGGSSSSSSSTTSSSTTGGGSGVTWTDLYNNVFGPSGTSTCTGSSCHTSTKSGFKCGTSKSTCYTGLVSSGWVTPGANASSSPFVDPAQSPLCGSLGGNMPIGHSCVTTTQVNQIKQWLAAGAPNN